MMEYERHVGVSLRNMYLIYDIANSALDKKYDGEKIVPVEPCEYAPASSLLSKIGGKQTPRTFTRGTSRKVGTDKYGDPVYSKTTTLAIGERLITIQTIDHDLNRL
jgi:hypothetical protein